MSAAKKPRIGRPPMAKKARKGALLSVRFTDEERGWLEATAVEHHLSLSEWARVVLLEAADDGTGLRAHPKR